MEGSQKVTLDDFFWCDNLNVFREIRNSETLELKGFKAYCSKMRKDIDDSFCHRCFFH
ncbi:MAG: hypothetical protein SWK76_11085 [Actinomycetota bacterium]|nr:hypothetical protein [Actinomycetota bacterium]